MNSTCNNDLLKECKEYPPEHQSDHHIASDNDVMSLATRASAINIMPIFERGTSRTIVFSFDERFAKYFSVVLVSLIDHAEKDKSYDLIVLYDSLSTQTMKRLQDMLPDGFSLRFIDVGTLVYDLFGDLSSKLSLNRWHASVFYDLLIPLIMPDYNQVLYLDSDIVICDSLKDIFDAYPKGTELVAVEDSLSVTCEIFPDNLFLKDQLQFVQNTLGIPDLSGYFNGGVLLFDPSLIDRDIYLQNIRTAFTFPKLPTVDQEILNYAFKDKWLAVPLRFNLHPVMLRILREKGYPEIGAAYQEAARDPAIMHYTTEKKPWVYPDYECAEHFWAAAKGSPFFEEILEENISELHDNQDLRLWKYHLSGLLALMTRGKRQHYFRHAHGNHKRLYLLKQMLRQR